MQVSYSLVCRAFSRSRGIDDMVPVAATRTRGTLEAATAQKEFHLNATENSSCQSDISAQSRESKSVSDYTSYT